VTGVQVFDTSGTKVEWKTFISRAPSYECSSEYDEKGFARYSKLAKKIKENDLKIVVKALV
jgi:hypothetical protein